MKNKILTSIQGLGPKISEKLINYFVDEETVIKAIEEARISEIASIKGIGRKLALKIIQEFHSGMNGIFSNEILKTEEVIKIYEQISEIIQSYAQTQFIKDKFSLLFPLPASKINIIKDRISYYKKNIIELEKISSEILQKLRLMLKKIKPLKPLDVKNRLNIHRIIITDIKEEYDKLIERDIEKYCKILLLKSFDDKELDFFNSFDLVIFITNTKIDQKFLNRIENPIILDNSWSISNIIPEVMISNFIGPNYEIIQTAYKLIKILNHLIKKSDLFSFDFQDLNIDEMDKLIFYIKLLDKNGSILPGNSLEFDKYKQIIDNFDGIIADQEIWINESIEKEIKSSKTTIEGNQIFNLLKSLDDSNAISFNNLMEIIPLNLSSIIEKTLTKGREQLIDKLQLDDLESSFVFDIFPNDISFPIEADNYAVQKLKNQLIKKKIFYEFQFLSNIAKNLSNLQSISSKMVKILFKLDELLAVKYFKDEYNLKYPNFYTNFRGISFKDAHNIFLLKEGIESVPITYQLGNIPSIFDCDLNEDIIILTGANSGGKTTLLQTIIQIVILSQMGFPVPAEVNIGPFDEIYYFAKSQGIVSSGAFETSLKQFADAIISPKSKLVLMDELESITEPGAAAKVVGSILELFWEKRSTSCILVSHLAEQILKVINIPFRIDGIEANGIDNGQLMVDRNPKFNYFAKSMPFFIIQKLYLSTTDPKKQKIYSKMMQYFDDNDNNLKLKQN